MIPPHYLVGTAAVTENLLKRKWSVVILRHLASGITDPVEITRLETDLSITALNERLRNMLRFSLIARYPRPATPKAVEYRLTLRGQKILNVLNIIEQLDQQPDKHSGSNGVDFNGATVPRTRISAQIRKRLILND